MGDIPCGQLVEGFDLRELCHTEELTDIKGIQDIILVRRFRDRATRRRAFKLKKLEEEGVMIEEGEKKKGGGRRKQMNAQDEKDFEDFMDDVEADPELRKNVKMYKDIRKDMTQEELDEVLGELDLCEMLDDLKIEDLNKEGEKPGVELDGIDDLISKMEKVTIEK